MEDMEYLEALREGYLAEIANITPPRDKHDIFMLDVYRKLLREMPPEVGRSRVSGKTAEAG